MKRSLIVFVVIAAIAAALIVYFTREEMAYAKETSVYKAIPETTPVFLECSSLKSVIQENSVLNKLNNSGLTMEFLDWAVQLDTLIKNDKNIQNTLRNESFIIAFAFAGKNNPIPVIIKKTESNNKRKDVESLFRLMFPGSQYSYEEKKYSGRTIWEVKSKASAGSLFFSFTDGLFLASTKEIFVEQAIRQLTTQSILNNPYFLKVNKTVTSQSNISWYLNHKYFPTLAANWLNGKSVERTNEFNETVKNNHKKSIYGFGKLAAWSELDFASNGNEITLNGISASDDSLHHFLSVFENQEAVKYDAADVLPKTTSSFISYSFSDKETFFKNLENYFTHSESYYKREERIKKMESSMRFNFKDFFRGITRNEIIAATTNISADAKSNTNYFIVHTEGGLTAEEQLNTLLTKYANRKKIELAKVKKTFKVDAETSYAIYNFPYPSFPGVWLDYPFTSVKAQYVAFHNNYMVFCNSEKGLEEYLHSMVLKATLSKDMQYLKFRQKTENRANINTYLNVNRSLPLIKDFLNENLSKYLTENEELFRKFYALNWQVVNEKNNFSNSVYVTFNQQLEEEAKTTWQSNVGSGISTKPQFVSNHNDRANREVILQDAKNNIQLLTKDGRVQWSSPVSEPILGKIHQIDYLKNGKLQYLFNTKSKLYLMDRKGNSVSGFPISFRSPATNGINVFDYDNNRNYRYFVACENRKVYALDRDGKILSGWSFGQTEHAVNHPIQHFRVASKDYIVFKDKSRIYIQNRRGETRVPVSAKFENSNNPLILNLNGSPKIVATDKTGKVYYIYFNGKFAEKETAKYSEDHFFTVSDLNGNGVPDFVFIDGKELTITDEKGKKLFSEKFKNKINHKPNIYTFANSLKKVGITDAVANRIYLFDSNGKLHDGFPLKGNSEFSIGEMSVNSGQFNLIVGSDGGDLYNYTLN